MKNCGITQDRLKQVVKYNQRTGEFVWRVSISDKARAGTKAGSVGKTRVKLTIEGVTYMAHRLAWLYVTGSWPVGIIDHIDTNGLNNRFKNLRDATSRINAHNVRKPRSNNTSGYLGVRQVSGGMWRATICVDYKHMHIGVYKTPKQAYRAYVAKKRELQEGCTL